MSKYGSWVSMKSMMKQEMNKIDRILNLSNLSDDDKQTIQDAYKEICYQWCQTNAFACLSEEVMMQMLDMEQRLKMQKLIVKLSLNYVTQKMYETYPWYDDDPEND